MILVILRIYSYNTVSINKWYKAIISIIIIDMQESDLSYFESRFGSKLSSEFKQEQLEANEHFIRTIEVGNLVLDEVIEAAFAVFGFTKVGKTTSCHHLCGKQRLETVKMCGELVWGQKQKALNNQFKIGFDNEPQTQLPNIFNAQLKDQGTLKVLDMPGYGALNFHRLVSNGYLHYRMFSKVKRLKFILVFERCDINYNAERVLNSIFIFIDTFKGYKQIKEEILGATVFLVTRVEQTGDEYEEVRQRFKELIQKKMKHLSEEQWEIFQQMVEHMLEKEKIYVLNKPMKLGTQSQRNTLLSDMHNKTRFWTRQTTEQMVEMSQINFSSCKILAKLTFSKGLLFKEEFNIFMKYMQKRFREIFLYNPNSLKNTLLCFIQDAQAMPTQADFLLKIKQFVKDEHQFDQRAMFKTKRMKFISTILGKNEKISKDKPNLQPYFIQKFNVLQNIFGILKQFNNSDCLRTKEELQLYWIGLKKMFRQFQRLLKNKKDINSLLHYSYSINRVIEQSKIISMLVDQYEHFYTFSKMYPILLSDFHALFKHEFIVEIVHKDIKQMKNDFLRSITVENFEKIYIETIKFFEPKGDINVKNKDIYVNFAKMIIKFVTILDRNKEADLPQSSNIYIAATLKKCRDDLIKIQTIYQQSADEEQIGNVREIIIEMTNVLANIFKRLGQHDFAIALYESIDSIDQLLQTYEEDIRKKKNGTEMNEDKIPCVHLYEKLGNFAESQLKLEKAMEIYQKALALCVNSQDKLRILNYMQNIIEMYKEPQTIKLVQQKLVNRRSQVCLVSFISEDRESGIAEYLSTELEKCQQSEIEMENQNDSEDDLTQ